MREIKRSTTFSNREFSFDEESRNYSGYGVVFNSDSLPFYVWHDGDIVEVVEQITRDSVEASDMSDLVGTFNHNFDKVLGRTSAGTMTYEIDENGVLYRFNMPNTSYANDLIESTKRRDVQGSSFMFSMDWSEGYDITERTDGSLLAIPKKITRIHEMGPVVKPAYPETTAENRSEGLASAVGDFFKRKKEEVKDDGFEENLKLFLEIESV